MLKKLKVTHRLVVLIVGVALPLIAVTFYATVTGVNQNINFALQEKKGNAYQRPLAALLDALPTHQWYASQVARGDIPAKTRMAEKEVEIDQIFTDLETVHAKYGAALQFTDSGLSKRKRAGLDPRNVKASWQKLKTAGATNPAETAEAHKNLIAAVRGMVRHAGDTSNLILDPDLDSYYLMDVTLLGLPEAQSRLAEIGGFANELLRKDKGAQSAKELAQLSAYGALLKDDDVDRINVSVEAARTEDAGAHGVSASLQQNLTEPLQAYNAACAEVLSMLDKAASAPGSVNADSFLIANQTARSAAYRLWKVAADELDVLLNQRASSLRLTRWLTLSMIVLALAVSVMAGWFLSQGILKPLSNLMSATQRVARGENNVRAPVGGEDEIGELASSFNLMLGMRQKASSALEAENKRLQANIQELLVVVSNASDGKLNVRARVSEGALGNVCDALNLMLENVGGIIANAKSASDQVAVASNGISTVAAELEKGEQRQTQEILTTSEGVRDLNGKAQKVLENCQSATKAAENGRKAAEQGAKAVREVIKGMEKIRENTQANAKKIKRLGDRSMEISGIVKVIGDISAKTDMLALNASIEAARAGEQGKGFTVVAEQVRGLADRTKTLTNQIEKLVNDIQRETGEAVAQMETQTQEVEAGARAAQSAGGTLENIVTVSSESSELVSQINQSATQQATRTQEMLATVESISQVVAASGAKVRETRSTSEQLLALSSELNKRLAQFEVAESLAIDELAVR